MIELTEAEYQRGLNYAFMLAFRLTHKVYEIQDDDERWKQLWGGLREIAEDALTQRIPDADHRVITLDDRTVANAILIDRQRVYEEMGDTPPE
jgi:hypothetical protein